MNLISAYRKTKLTTRIIVFSALLVLIATISWVNNANVLLNAGLTLIGGIGVEALLKYSRKTVLILIWGLNLFMLGFFVYTIFAIYIGTSTYEDAVLNAGLVGIAGLLSSILSHILVYNLPVGAQWANLLICFPLFFISVAILIMYVPSAPMWVVSFVSVIIVAAYPVILTMLKALIKRFRKNEETHEYPKNKNVTLLNQSMEDSLKTFIEIPKSHGSVRKFFNNKFVAVVVPLSGDSRSVILENNTLKVDDKDFTWVLEDVVSEARSFSKNNRINQNNITPIVLIYNTNLKSGITPIKVRKRSNPDKVLGTVLIVSNSKLNSLVKTLNEQKKLSTREVKTLELIAQQF